jgi:hypothetical protein
LPPNESEGDKNIWRPDHVGTIADVEVVRAKRQLRRDLRLVAAVKNFPGILSRAELELGKYPT